MNDDVRRLEKRTDILGDRLDKQIDTLCEFREALKVLRERIYQLERSFEDVKQTES